MQPNNLRVRILFTLVLLFFIEVYLYYSNLIQYSFRYIRAIEWVVFCYWLIEENKQKPIQNVRLLLLSFGLLIPALFVIYFADKSVLDFFELILISSSYLRIVNFFIKEKANIQFKSKIFFRILIPYLLFPLAFYANSYSFLPQSAIYVSFFS
jgi:hypothetical protein